MLSKQGVYRREGGRCVRGKRIVSIDSLFLLLPLFTLRYLLFLVEVVVFVFIIIDGKVSVVVLVVVIVVNEGPRRDIKTAKTSSVC